ncbi:MAG TPA: hypothetical protein VFA28_08420 [Bryobacteraceae bacterium]|nr:hypothetical protein [Bryobacteraceae bacterium]
MGAGVKLAANVQAWVDKGLFDRLPVTFSAFFLEQMREWDLLFPAEQDYFTRLFTLLDRAPAPEVDGLFEPVRAAERLMGVNERTWPRRRFTLEQVDFLNRNAHYSEWRAAIARVFSQIDPILDAEAARRGRPRLVVVISPADLPVGPDRMWTRIAARGRRIALRTPEDVREFVPLLLTGAASSERAASITTAYSEARGARYEAWSIEAGERLGALEADAKTVNLSYKRLAPYRQRLMEEVDRTVRAENISGPQQLSLRLKAMKIEPGESALAGDPVLAEFTRATLLNGNGTLLVNNTFVEWSTIQAARRARPSLVIVSFGVRNKVKPFSSLLIYADQDRVSEIPSQMDALGSYVDLEIFYQYLWQEFEKYPEYRRNTAYIFVGEGMDEALVIAPPDFPLKPDAAPVSLTVVNRRMREWVNV